MSSIVNFEQATIFFLNVMNNSSGPVQTECLKFVCLDSCEIFEKYFFFSKIKLKKPKILPHHLGDRLGIHDQSVVSLPPFALRRHTVVVLYDPSEKINKMKLHIGISFTISKSFFQRILASISTRKGRSSIMRSSVLITYKFLKNLIRQQTIYGHPKLETI